MGAMSEIAADIAMAGRFGIGGNSPPAVELHRMHIEDLLSEAKNYLDGEPIATQSQADSIGVLLGQLREARKGADTQRAAEKKPHDDAGKEVQAAWLPIIQRADLAADTAKKALAPFLAQQEAEKLEAARAARAEADRIAREAQEAFLATDVTDLATREEAERLLKEAGKANKAANRAEKDKAMVAGGARAVSLRSVWTATVDDYGKLLAHYKATHPARIKCFLDDEAAADVRTGTRSLPGVTITETKVAV